MKKILILLLTPILVMTYSPLLTHAQENEIQIEQEENEEQPSLLIDKLEQTEDTEEIQAPPQRSFFTILGAILIPSILIIICYLIFKFFKF